MRKELSLVQSVAVVGLVIATVCSIFGGVGLTMVQLIVSWISLGAFFAFMKVVDACNMKEQDDAKKLAFYAEIEARNRQRR